MARNSAIIDVARHPGVTSGSIERRVNEHGSLQQACGRVFRRRSSTREDRAAMKLTAKELAPDGRAAAQWNDIAKGLLKRGVRGMGISRQGANSIDVVPCDRRCS